ncbi:hypothetical protein [Bacillus suaedaesalsae]|uniref:Uncharacterized protein n=1 Tax=Bacillus suaedaesalsae TaxID=2810349 RepID=A0ABS2DL28_9BACI|nr:hypothetical protein [Bacillus suaedaesalsae]MBM6618236.1 hypothetical protein [Bacillus suaedaesalsae]
MGLQNFSCDNLARQDYREILNNLSGQFVILVGENNNILGFGEVGTIYDAIVQLSFDLGGAPVASVDSLPTSLENLIGSIEIPDLDFYVNLCRVGSIIVPSELTSGSLILGLLLVLLILGLITIEFLEEL